MLKVNNVNQREKEFEMKKVSKDKFGMFAVIVILVGLGTVIGGDVVVQQGVIEGMKFKGTSCTASGNGSTAMGFNTVASGTTSTAMGYETSASGSFSTAMGYYTTATASRSIAMGDHVDATGFWTTALGKYSANSVANSFTVGYGSSGNPQVDFRVESGLVTVCDDLFVTHDVDANTYSEHSSFYDRDSYGRALDYARDSSETIRVNAQGRREYDHEVDPEFLKKWVTVKDYDQYTDEQIWNEETQEFETVRTYETHQELRSSLSMKVAWLRQCVFELKQENENLKARLEALEEQP